MITFRCCRIDYFSIFCSKTCRSILLCPQNTASVWVLRNFAAVFRLCEISHRLFSENSLILRSVYGKFSLIFCFLENLLLQFFDVLNEISRNLTNFPQLPRNFKCQMCEISSKNSPNFRGISMRTKHKFHRNLLSLVLHSTVG